MVRKVSASDGSVIIRVPMSFRKHGGRKRVVVPEGNSSWAPPTARVNSTLVKALARAFRWRKLMETGVHATVEEIAAAERINASYVSRVLRLTLLAPDIVDEMLNGHPSYRSALPQLLRPFPNEWRQQLNLLRTGSHVAD